MAREVDYYSADEAARVLGLSPARVRQMLRSGELEGERREERIEGVLGPWRVPKRAVEAFRGRREAEDAEATAVLPPGEAPGAVRLGEPRSRRPDDTPSRTSERLSEALGKLKSMTHPLLEEMQRLEGQLEAAEIEQIALQEALRLEKERSERLEAELEAERSLRRGERRGTSWRDLFGG